MAYETILFDRADGIARLRLNRPVRLNAFNLVMHAEINDALNTVESDSSASLMIWAGVGGGWRDL